MHNLDSMKKLFLFCLFSFSIGLVPSFAASALRSDSLDIRKTIITFNITDFVSKNIFAKTTLDVKCKLNNINQFIFDLEGFTVDSVKINATNTTYSLVGFDLKINTPTTFNQNDTALVDVYYHGIPVADATWGGFSYVGNYGFQMGVGFNAQPHSFGRTWHPCFDNFVERSSYEYFITTNADKLAICNGLLIDSSYDAIANTRNWHWKLEEEIPSYLSSVAVCNYIILKKTLNGNNGIVHAEIACEPIDSNNVNGSFAHLQESFSMLEQRFGSYVWPKVGYTLVPFNAGAMEHATNIHIGKPFVNGTLDYETLIAHELSHHWWGDLVTCSNAGDMWLNEGFASYCEYLHQEYTYGYASYLTDIKANHFYVLSNAHLNDGAYKSVANIDSLHTYGTTVYLKGADMIHTMRTYLGDSLFFNGLTAFLDAYKWKDINTYKLRDFLTNYTGINMNDYFDNWIFDKGFTHFSIDSTQFITNGNMTDCSVFIRQRKHQNNNYFNNVPLEIGFYDDQMNKYVHKLNFIGRCMQYNIQLPFKPAMIVIDPDSKLSDAITEETKIIKIIGTTIMNQAKCRLYAKQISNTNDSCLIRVEHNWVNADRFKTTTAANGYVLASNHYWKVDAINLSNLQGTMGFTFDAGANNSYLDSTWIKNLDDSIRLFYRKDATEEWQLANDSLKAGASNDRYGNIYVKELKIGEYCMGIKTSTYQDPVITDAPNGGCGLVSNAIDYIANKKQFTIYPNPSSGKIFITSESNLLIKEIHLVDVSGQIIVRKKINSHQLTHDIDCALLENGLYLIQVYDKENHLLQTEKIIKN